MNTKTNNHRSGVSPICVGIGIYLLALELVRLINYFVAELSTLTMEIYLLICFVCSALITVGIIKMVRRAGSVVALILGIVSFPILFFALFYFCPYLVPMMQHWSYEVSDWLLFSIICFAGILLVVWGVVNCRVKK
jgi:hypothetical protein